jgi:acyl-CoA thioester hydrolase
MPVRVYYQDTDAGGVMFHANYLHFFERARTEWLRELGFDVRGLAETHDLLFIVRELRMNFLRPAVVDDLLTVTAVIENLGRAQFTLGQCVLRKEELLVQGSVNLACVTAHGLGPVRLPPDVYTVLERSADRAATREEEA